MTDCPDPDPVLTLDLAQSNQVRVSETGACGLTASQMERCYGLVETFKVNFINNNDVPSACCGEEKEFKYTLSWDCLSETVDCPAEWNDETCDETCTFDPNQIEFQLNSAEDHVVYKELEPEIFLPVFQDSQIEAFRPEPEKCFLGADSFGKTRILLVDIDCGGKFSLESIYSDHTDDQIA